MPIRTDLALETLDGMEDRDRPGSGIRRETLRIRDIEATCVLVETEEAARAVGKPMGEYWTVDTADFKSAPVHFESEVAALAELLRRLLPKERADACALVVGLGNREITPDALGPRAAGYILATRHIPREVAEQIGVQALRPVAVLAAGVMGQTGIETAEITAAVVQKLQPAVVIVVDALAARSVDRLASTVQLSNTGISPGSGVQNRRAELSRKTLGVPVISIGVPMVVDMATVACDMLGQMAEGRVSDKGRTMMVTPREVDLAVEHAARTVAFAINSALQPGLTLEELIGLAG